MAGPQYSSSHISKIGESYRTAGHPLASAGLLNKAGRGRAGKEYSIDDGCYLLSTHTPIPELGFVSHSPLKWMDDALVVPCCRFVGNKLSTSEWLLCAALPDHEIGPWTLMPRGQGNSHRVLKTLLVRVSAPIDYVICDSIPHHGR